MRAYFNIYGLPLEINTDHPLLFKSFTEDLRFFQVKRIPPSRNTVRITLTDLPFSLNGAATPALFAPYREMVSPFSFRSASDTFVASYGRSAVTVVTRLRQRQIQAAVIPEPSLLPDPFFYYSFTEPMSLWFKQRGLFFLHAGCVTEAGAGILIVGNPRAGKSALTTSAVRGGFRFLADEQPLLSLHRGTLRAFAFPRRIRLDRSVARLFPELKELMKSNPSERLAFPIEKIWPGCLTLSCRPRLLLFPCYRPRKKLRTAPLSSSAVLKKLFRDPFFLWHRQRSLERISHLHLALLEYCARHLRGFTLEYGEEELHKIPALFRKLLSG